jgi:anti-anti-sigma factor
VKSSLEGGMASGLFAVERVGDTLVVTPLADLGEFDYQQIGSEAGHVSDLLNDPSVRNVVLAFGRTAYFGSSALAFFVRLWAKLSTRSGRMAFCNVSPQEGEVLKLTRLDGLWPVCGSREEAVRRVGAP